MAGWPNPTRTHCDHPPNDFSSAVLVVSKLIFLFVKVPLSLAIRVTTLRGTLRVHIKPPPSDQIWFGFTSMPDIDFSLESAVGDHKITSGHLALFIINKFKVSKIFVQVYACNFLFSSAKMVHFNFLCQNTTFHISKKYDFPYFEKVSTFLYTF